MKHAERCDRITYCGLPIPPLPSPPSAGEGNRG